MKIAIAYDWLNQKIGGGEQTLFEIAKLYPDADIYCLIYNKKKFAQYVGDRKIYTSRLNKFPGYMKRRPNLLLPFIKRSVEKLNFEGYDLVISVSSAWVKNINVPDKTCHISYCYSPARMLWDSWPGYLDTQKFGPLKVGAISRFAITRMVSKLRLWDYYQSKNVFEFVAISRFISGRIEKFYKRDSKSIQVVYPPVETKITASDVDRKDTYLCISTLSKYKNLDIVINAFKNNKKQLIIAGDGPDRARLQEIAGSSSNIKFLGRVSNEEKATLLLSAKAFIFPGLEDFGIAPVEALAAGTPVIAMRGGGLLETIVEDKNGILFDKPSAESLTKAINIFENQKFDTNYIIKSAEKFSYHNFDQNFKQTIDKIYKRWGK